MEEVDTRPAENAAGESVEERAAGAAPAEPDDPDTPTVEEAANTAGTSLPSEPPPADDAPPEHPESESAAAAEPEDPDTPTVEEAATAAGTSLPSEPPPTQDVPPEQPASESAAAAEPDDPDTPTVEEAATAAGTSLAAEPGTEISDGVETRTTPEESAEAEKLALLEAIVYITDEPLSVQHIAGALGQSLEQVRQLLDKLVAEYAKPHHGLVVREVAGGYKMATKPEHHEAVRTFVRNLNPPLKLSLAALETLAVIAYKQPITAPEIMEIRGVQGAGVLKTLLDRKLITTAGRKNVVGRPILYRTTKDFLVQFGLKDLNELPTLKEFEELRRLAIGDADQPVLGAEEPSPAPPAPKPEEPAPPVPQPEEPAPQPDQPESPGTEPEPESPGGSTDPEPHE